MANADLDTMKTEPRALRREGWLRQHFGWMIEQDHPVQSGVRIVSALLILVPIAAIVTIILK